MDNLVVSNNYPNDIEIYNQFVILKNNIMNGKESDENYQKMKTLLNCICLKYAAIQYGNFTLKSKKKSNYFFSSGQLNNMVALNVISFLMAHLITSKNCKFDYIFGASYKGIPIATLTSQYIFTSFQTQNIFFLYDRKEEKTYGDKTNIIGLPPDVIANENENENSNIEENEINIEKNEINKEKKTRVYKTILIDDVFTCGTAANEILQKLKKYKNIEIVAIFTILDRNEYELNEKNEKVYYKNIFEQKHNIPIYSILTYEEDISNLRKKI